MNVRTIHHFEDEPELVHWVPGTLLNLYWRRHPDWIVEDGRFNDEDDRLTTFELHVDSSDWKVEYRLYQSPSEFAETFDEHAKPGDVVLVDLFDASMRVPLGVDVYKAAIGALGESAIYFLTAFPQRVQEFLSVPEAQVLAKPIDAKELTNLLFQKLAIR